MRHALLALLCLLLLTGCAGQPAPSAEVTPSPSADTPSPSQPPPLPEPSGGSVRVEAHWDMLEEKGEPLVSRWHEGYTGDLIPDDGYGPLVPYIGGELVEHMGLRPDGSPYLSSGWVYGLATEEGVVVTDAVYDDIHVPGYEDALTGLYPSLPVWVVARMVFPPDGEPYTLSGIAARDGSWYTGLVFRTEGVGLQVRAPYITTSEAGLLMAEASGEAVMIGLDGSERYRWAASDFPPPDPSVDASFANRLGNGLRSHGPYWSYNEDRVRSAHGKLPADSPTLWLDACTGEVLAGRPADVPEAAGQPQNHNRYYFSGGWYDRDDPSTLHFDDGTSMATPLWQEGDILRVSPPLIGLLGIHRVVLARLDGEVLFQQEVKEGHSYGLSSLYNQTGGPTLFHYQDTDHENGDVTTRLFFDPEGRPVDLGADRLSNLTVNGNTVTLVEESWYRLTDLQGNDLLRLPRLAAMEHLADE